MKKILMLVVDMFNPGGVQQYTRDLCGALTDKFNESEFIVISLYDSHDNPGAGHWKNMNIKFCAQGTGIKGISKILFIIKTALAIVRERPHFLICGHVDLSPLAVFLKKIFHLKYAVLTHGADVWDIKSGAKYRGLKNADIIVTVSRYTGRKLIANGIDENRIEYLSDMVDTSLFYPKRPEAGLIERLGLRDKRVLLTVGRLHPDERYKGHDIMLNVLQRLDKKYIWLIVGDGDDLPRLKRKAKELNLIGRAIFLGWVGDTGLADYYNLCDCFIMPSKGEGFGIVFLEALACGKPVIGGNKDGSLEPLLGGRLGFTADPDNIESIISAIDSVFTASDDRVNPERLREEVENNFGIENFKRKAGEIFSAYLS